MHERRTEVGTAEPAYVQIKDFAVRVQTCKIIRQGLLRLPVVAVYNSPFADMVGLFIVTLRVCGTHDNITQHAREEESALCPGLFGQSVQRFGRTAVMDKSAGEAARCVQ